MRGRRRPPRTPRARAGQPKPASARLAAAAAAGEEAAAAEPEPARRPRGAPGARGDAGSGLQTGAKTGRERSRSRWRRGRRATRGTGDAEQPPGQLSRSGGACRAQQRAARSQAPAQPLHSTHCASAPAPPLLLLPLRPLHFYRLDSSTAPHGACAAPSLPGARGPVRPPSLRALARAVLDSSVSRSRARGD